MSGSITTAIGVIWHSAGWVFRNILDRTAQILNEQGHPSLVRILTDEMGPVRLFEMLDLAELSREDRASFFAALTACHQRYESEGGREWRSPEFFPGFMERFGELVAAVAAAEQEGGAR
jgi:hypothetical protein